MKHKAGARVEVWALRTVLGAVLTYSCGVFPDSAVAQRWVKTTAPFTNWVSIASSADGSNLVAAASQSYVVDRPGPIFVSGDSGDTWTQTPAPYLLWRRVASSADGKKIFATVNDETLDGARLWSSTNGGGAWLAQGYLTNVDFLASSADGGTVLAGGFPYYLAVSKDGGMSWKTTRIPVSTFVRGIVVSADGTRLMACVEDASSTFLWLYASTDSGQTWSANPGPDSSSNPTAFAGAADATTLVAAVNVLGVFRSPDWGQTWQVQTQGWPMGIGSMVSSADGSKLMLSSNGSIYESTNSGMSWFDTDAPGEGTLACSADGRKFFLLSGGLSGRDIYRYDSSSPLANPERLKINQLQNSLLLSWDVPSTAVLQQADYLGATNWVRVPTEPVMTNGQLQVTVEPSALGRSFYRLSQP